MCAQYLHSEACAIELEDRVILTGLGFVPTQVTSQYQPIIYGISILSICSIYIAGDGVQC